MLIFNAIFGYILGFSPRERVLYPQVTFQNDFTGREELLSLERDGEFYQFLLKRWGETSKENKVVALPGYKRKSLYIYTQGTVTLHEVKYVFEGVPDNEAGFVDTAIKLGAFDQEYVREHLLAYMAFQSMRPRLVVVK